MTDIAHPPPPSAASRLPLYALIAANLVSLLGNSITNLAILWYVIDTTGSAANAGLAGFFTLLPMVISTFFGGALVDRFGRKRMSIISDLASGITVVTIPILYQTIGLPLPVLFALIFLGALLDAPGSTARRAMLPELAGKAGMPLERATSAMQSVSATVELLGPIIAGVLVAVLGTTTVLYIDAATFLASALIIGRMLPAMPSLLQAGSRYLDEVREGIAFLRSKQLLVTILVAALVLNFFAAPFGGVFLPVFATDQNWGARSLGLLFSGFGAGMILGSVLFGAFGIRFKRRTWLLGALIYLGATMALLSIASILPVAVGLIVLSGIALGVINPLVGTVFLEQVPAELRGRVLGAMAALSMCASPLGMLVAGPTVQAIGVTAAFVIAGAVFVAVGLALATRPVLHQMERAPLDPEPIST